jgi:hypothetical protein
MRLSSSYALRPTETNTLQWTLSIRTTPEPESDCRDKVRRGDRASRPTIEKSSIGQTG